MIYDIANCDTAPLSYKCRPRDIILHHHISWTSIEQDLKFLEKDELIKLGKEDTVVIFITAAGLEKIKAELKFNARKTK